MKLFLWYFHDFNDRDRDMISYIFYSLKALIVIENYKNIKIFKVSEAYSLCCYYIDQKRDVMKIYYVKLK